MLLLFFIISLINTILVLSLIRLAHDSFSVECLSVDPHPFRHCMSVVVKLFQRLLQNIVATLSWGCPIECWLNHYASMIWSIVYFFNTESDIAIEWKKNSDGTFGCAGSIWSWIEDILFQLLNKLCVRACACHVCACVRQVEGDGEDATQRCREQCVPISVVFTQGLTFQWRVLYWNRMAPVFSSCIVVLSVLHKDVS